MHLNIITVSLYWRCSFTGSQLISRDAGVMCSKFLGFCDDSAREIMNSLKLLDVCGSCV